MRGDDGAITALANRVYRELRAQLGRNAENFKLWRDKDALAAGVNWKDKLNEAVSESVFFIAMVSPSALNSPFCRYEFERFLERERELGRDDLVFPVLYISVPELEQKNRTETDAFITIVKDREYVDWRGIRHRTKDAQEVKETVEQFCNHVVRALRKKWLSPEEREQIETERRLQEEHRLQEAERKRRAEEEDRQRAAEAKRRAAEERIRRDTEGRTRDVERAERAQSEKQGLSEREGTGSQEPGAISTWLHTMPSKTALRILGVLLMSNLPYTLASSQLFVGTELGNLDPDAITNTRLFFLCLGIFSCVVGLGVLSMRSRVSSLVLTLCGLGIAVFVLLAIGGVALIRSKGVDIVMGQFVLLVSLPYLIVYLLSFLYFYRWRKSLSVSVG